LKKKKYAALIAAFILGSGILNLALTSSSPVPIPAVDGPELFQVFSSISLTRPLGIYFPDDNSNRVFTLEKPGIIRVFDNEPGVSSSEVFLDLTANVSEEGNEMGLLGLAFHPEFEENGIFFVDYTAVEPRRTVIARYTVDSENPNLADVESAEVIFEVEQPYVNHNGGQIAFGPDGYLYIAMGDGGGGGDPLENAQNRTNVHGAILRIDVDSPDPGLGYGIPDDNPYAGNDDGYAEEIFAYGLRNPWRFSFDNETGDLWAGDVGQNAIEEIDIIKPGRNYGWDIKEGTQCFEPPSGCDDFGLTDPVYEYAHTLGRSITSGFVYRGTLFPSFAGKYIYGDFISGRIWALTYDGENVTGNEELFNRDLAIASFGQDTNGELYVVDFNGAIYSLGIEEETTITSTDTTTTTTPSTTPTSTGSCMLTLPILLTAGVGILVVFAVVYYVRRSH
jgi:glucose/arabinose dehydrogenase